MTYYLDIIKEALKIVFQKKLYILGAAFTTIAVFVIVVAVPIFTIPGNDLAFQLSLMPPRDYGTIVILSMLTGIAAMLQIYVFRRESKKKVEKVGLMSVTGSFGVVSAFFGSVTCIACASTFLSILGLGTVTFLIVHRLEIVLISILFIVLSIYFTSRKVLNLCDICKVR